MIHLCYLLFGGTCITSWSICFHPSDSAVSICDGSFAWERDGEPLLKKYVWHQTHCLLCCKTLYLSLLVCYCIECNYWLCFCQCFFGHQTGSVGRGSWSCGLREVLSDVSHPGRNVQHQRLRQHSGETLFPSSYLSKNTPVFHPVHLMSTSP